jgi:hypothetical protein
MLSLLMGCSLCLLGQVKAGSKGMEATRLDYPAQTQALSTLDTMLSRKSGKGLRRVLEVVPLPTQSRAVEEQWMVEDQAGKAHPFWIQATPPRYALDKAPPPPSRFYQGMTLSAPSVLMSVRVVSLPMLPLSPRATTSHLRPISVGNPLEQVVALVTILANQEAQRDDCPLAFVDIQALPAEPGRTCERWICEDCQGERISFRVQFGPGTLNPAQVPKGYRVPNPVSANREVRVEKESAPGSPSL